MSNTATINGRTIPFDAIRETSCKDRRDALTAVCKERHKGIDRRLNFIVTLVTGEFIGIAILIIKLFLNSTGSQ